MPIDAHQHHWQVGRNGFAWPTPDLTAIHRDFLPPDRDAAAAGAGVDTTVVVQSQASGADTDWLLGLAERTPSIAAVVGWTDLHAPGAAARIAQLVTQPLLRGLRPMLQNLPDDDWITDPALDPALDAMAAAGLTLDALVFMRHLPALERFARRRPDIGIVIDHGAKPPIRTGDLTAWRHAIARLAAIPSVHCKLSGLLTEAEADAGDPTLSPVVAHLVDCFGSDRLMWGSDWPVLGLRASYADWFAMARRLILAAGGDPAAVLDGTARRFYRVKDASVSSASH